MSFERNIQPLTEFLNTKGFSICHESIHYIEYCTDSVIITLAYNNLEYLYYIHVGKNKNALIELTPKSLEYVFDENRFQFQSTLTIDNFILFLSGKGEKILTGDETKLIELATFSNDQPKLFTQYITNLQSLNWADRAWAKKDYFTFLKCIDQTDKAELAESYLKKYKIATDKLTRNK